MNNNELKIISHPEQKIDSKTDINEFVGNINVGDDVVERLRELGVKIPEHLVNTVRTEKQDYFNRAAMAAEDDRTKDNAVKIINNLIAQVENKVANDTEKEKNKIKYRVGIVESRRNNYNLMVKVEALQKKLKNAWEPLAKDPLAGLELLRDSSDAIKKEIEALRKDGCDDEDPIIKELMIIVSKLEDKKTLIQTRKNIQESK